MVTRLLPQKGESSCIPASYTKVSGQPPTKQTLDLQTKQSAKEVDPSRQEKMAGTEGLIPDSVRPHLLRTEQDPRPVVLMTCGIAGSVTNSVPPATGIKNMLIIFHQAPASPPSQRPSWPPSRPSRASPSTR
jgi:hypothetical protein